MARDRIGKLIGTYSCWCCHKEIPVRKKAEEVGGSLSAVCLWCGFANVARRGTEHYETLLGQLKPSAADPGGVRPSAEPTPGPSEPAPQVTAQVPAHDRSFASPLFSGSRPTKK